MYIHCPKYRYIHTGYVPVLLYDIFKNTYYELYTLNN